MARKAFIGKTKRTLLRTFQKEALEEAARPFRITFLPDVFQNERRRDPFHRGRREDVKSAKNETLQTIRQRRSIRLFTKEEVSNQDINLLLLAANEAPSAHNQQSWKFIVMRDKKKQSWLNSSPSIRMSFPAQHRPCSAWWREAFPGRPWSLRLPIREISSEAFMFWRSRV